MSLEQLIEWGQIVALVFVILGVPGIIGVVVHLNRITVDRLKQQIALSEQRIALNKDERDWLSRILEDERDKFKNEREDLEKSLKELREHSTKALSDKEKELNILQMRLNEVNSNIRTLDNTARLVKRSGSPIRYENDKTAIRDTVTSVLDELSQNGESESPELEKMLIGMVYPRLHHGILIRRSGEIDDLIRDELKTIKRSH
jgi:chromosome segregation ATPase